MNRHLLFNHGEVLIILLLDGVGRELDHEHEASLDHLPLVHEKARRDRHELTEMALAETAAE